jgi:hypothetical protein
MSNTPAGRVSKKKELKMIEKVEDMIHRLETECESSAAIRVQINRDTISKALDHLERNKASEMTLQIAYTSEFPIPGDYAATIVAQYVDEWSD